jgi:hypothetical protein
MQSPPLNDLYEHDVAPLVPEPPLRAPPRHTDFANDQFASNKPSISRRMFRALAWFLVAVLIGVGGTLAWQSYGDEAKQMVVARAPSLGWLLSVSTTSPPDRRAPIQDAAIPQSAPVAQIPGPAAPVASAEIVQQLEPMARDLAAVQHSLEQLAVRQDQMAQSIATLQAVEQDIKQKLASPAPRAVPTPPRKPPHPATQSSAVQSSSVPPPPSPNQQPMPLH